MDPVLRNDMEAKSARGFLGEALICSSASTREASSGAVATAFYL